MGKGAWRGGPGVARRAFPSCCIHCLGGGEVRGADAAKRGWGGSAAGRPQLPELCPQGWAPRARRAGGGRQRRARAARRGRAAGGAVSGEAPRARGLARSARLAGLSAGSPAAAAAPQPPAGPWRLTVSALGRGGPRWEAAGPRGGKFSSLDTCPYAGLADQRLGFPSPLDGPLVLCPSPFATSRDFRGAGGPGSPFRRDVAEGRAPHEGGGDAGMRWGGEAEGAALAVVWGQRPQAQGQALGIPATQAPLALGAASSRSASSPGLDLRTCLWG